MPIRNNFAINGRKFCTGCQTEKDVSEFGIQRTRKDGLDYRCKACMRARLKERYKDESYRQQKLATGARWREAHPDADMNKYYKRKYGITMDDYNRMFVEQNGVCAICGKEEKTRRRKKSSGNERLAVDHCHETGEIRGLLCFKCNTAMGSLGDTRDHVMRVIHYLSKSLSDSDGESFRIGKSSL